MVALGKEWQTHDKVAAGRLGVVALGNKAWQNLDEVWARRLGVVALGKAWQTLGEV